jgi:hypothetical protein
MQCSPPLNTGMLDFEGLELTSHTNMALPPLDTPLYEEAAKPLREAMKPLSRLSPEPVQAPINAEGHLELFQGEALQHMTWHKIVECTAFICTCLCLCAYAHVYPDPLHYIIDYLLALDLHLWQVYHTH